MQNHSAHKTALVLSGGGSHGAYEVGVIGALFEGRSPSTSGAALEPEVYVGTSVGGFNAAVLAMDKGGAKESFDRLQAIWKHRIADNGDGRGNGVYRIRGNPVDYLDPMLPGGAFGQLIRLVEDTAVLGRAAAPRVLDLIWPDGQPVQRIMNLVDVSMFVDGEPFRRLVEESIEPRAIRESLKALKVIATDWRTGDPRDFQFQQMADEQTWQAICASAAIPGLFPPVTVGEEIFVDGGVVQNTPIRPAVHAGAAEIHIVSLNPKMTQLPESHIDNTFETFSRVYAAMLATNVTADLKLAKRINDGIEVLEQVDEGKDVRSGAIRRFARVAGEISHRLQQDGKLPRMLTIHHYYPRKDLGGMLSMLNFQRDSVDAMIDEGYADTCAHDCKANGCATPAVVERTEGTTKSAAAQAS